MIAQNVHRRSGVLHFQLDIAGVPTTARYGIEHPLTRQPDPTFVWTNPCKDVAEAIEHNERAFVHSPSGTGKSSLIRQIAALVKRCVRRVSLNGETSVVDFVGHRTVNEKKETVFAKGILPQAMLEGYILQLDEVDAMQLEIGRRPSGFSRTNAGLCSYAACARTDRSAVRIHLTTCELQSGGKGKTSEGQKEGRKRRKPNGRKRGGTEGAGASGTVKDEAGG